MKKKISLLSMLVILVMTFLAGCGSGLKDGYFTAEMSDFSHGWKEYLRIQVKNGTVVSAEFNAKNESGFIKAWDNAYMKNMGTIQGTYPNRYTREYVQQLIEKQKNIKVDMVSGASSSGSNFEKLVQAVLEKAEKGDSQIAVVPSEAE